MIRFTKSEERERTIISIAGHLTGDYVEAIEICCNQAASEGKPVDVFLQDVLAIDEAGRALLSRLTAKGIRLFAGGTHPSYVVREIVSSSRTSLSSAAGGR